MLRIHATSPFHTNLCPQCFEFLIKLILHFSGTGEGKREREMGSVRDKREEGREGKEKPEHSAADTFTHRPAPFTCWCDMEVLESCEREMCMRDGARPGLRGRREGRDTG